MREAEIILCRYMMGYTHGGYGLSEYITLDAKGGPLLAERAEFLWLEPSILGVVLGDKKHLRMVNDKDFYNSFCNSN